MFEFDQARTFEKPPLISPSEPLELVAGVKRRSLLIWSEHCIECAAPECYQSCDLYQARPDERCRRFEFGMRPNDQLKGYAGSAAEIVFERWAKLECRGNSVMLPSTVVKLIELTFRILAPAVSAIGKLVRRCDGSPPWTSLTFELQDMLARKLQWRSTNSVAPGGFLLEIYNPTDDICRLKFAVEVSSSSAARSGKVAPLPYWALLELTPGYNRCVVDYDSIKAIVKSGLPYNISLTPEAESGAHLVFISLDFVDSVDAKPGDVKIQASQLGQRRARPAVKCVVFDLDNTLWKGVLVEGDVTLKDGIEELFRTLDERGILISVASKNNENAALAQLALLGLDKYLVHPVINWAQKSENIKLLASRINIGIDTFLFVDDNPFERAEVASALPLVEVLPDTALATLAAHPRLVGGTTSESKNRRRMYQEQIVRDEAVVAFGDDYIEFLQQCEIELEISADFMPHQARVIELLQRTNQLNFSGRKYSRDEILSLFAEKSVQKHLIRCKDKFGDYGIVGFAISHSRHDTVTVQDFMLSCRVQGKLIEKAFFDFLVKTAIQDHGMLYVNFLPGDRNAPAQAVLRELDFVCSDDRLWSLKIEPDRLAVKFLKVRTD